MFAFLNLSVEAMTILFVFGSLVVVPVIVGIGTRVLDCRAKQRKAPG